MYMNLMQECFSAHHLALGVQANSPLRRRLNHDIAKLVESGLVEYWFHDSITKSIEVWQLTTPTTPDT
ncbi:hypothetical protein Pmani_001157 [Petrolisthes manimaculis]|uniref:Uncharacterized protein n=1 Tax=Petrolisthes manimaculis TaxID=1843537 RepID=A0AAE1QL99_9EUCA|nr:hypothetical protein Pmani_001157 [Petrolisthes manimaculis]